jgi:hypothetical protein
MGPAMSADELNASNGLPAWRTILYDMHASGLAESARTLFDTAVEPTCLRVSEQLAAIERGPDDEAITQWDALRDIQLELHRSFALALGGLWERHFRQHLSQSVILLAPGKTHEDVETADWKGLNKLFREARGFPLSRFPTYGQLELLHRVTSAVRHGNGSSTKYLFKTNPTLFGHEPIRDFLAYMTLGGEPPHSIHRLEITLEQLRAFKTAIVEFWLMVEALRTSPNAC